MNHLRRESGTYRLGIGIITGREILSDNLFSALRRRDLCRSSVLMSGRYDHVTAKATRLREDGRQAHCRSLVSAA